MKYDIKINNQEHSIEAEADMPILWVLRDMLHMTGTKYGCGKGLCGACTIHIDGIATRSCLTPISSVKGKKITTIEGMNEIDGGLHPLQQAWIEADVPQCGYCQSGQIMQASSLLNKNPTPSVKQIDKAMNGNLCRCGSYTRIRSAINLIVDANQGGQS